MTPNLEHISEKLDEILRRLPGSPRKVGEDGALTEDEQATVAMLERWRDKGTMLTNAELLVLKLARSSSVPVGEQKQEEGATKR